MVYIEKTIQVPPDSVAKTAPASQNKTKAQRSGFRFERTNREPSENCRVRRFET